MARLADRGVAGVAGFVIEGLDSLGDENYEFGALHAERTVRVALTHRASVDGAADSDARVTEPLLTSGTWPETRRRGSTGHGR